MRHRLVEIGQTVARISADEERFLAAAEQAIRKERRAIASYLRRHPHVRHALAPCAAAAGAPFFIARMADAAARAGVGPMAAVAGAIAEAALWAMIRSGATHAIVENGGDIALMTSRPVVVAVFDGRVESPPLGLRLDPRAEPLGICTSSGTVGHSLSFGVADAVTVIAPDVCLADAAATALANRVRDTTPEAIVTALEAGWVDGVEGAIITCAGHTGFRGRLPAIVPVDPGAAEVWLAAGRPAPVSIDMRARRARPGWSRRPPIPLPAGGAR